MILGVGKCYQTIVGKWAKKWKWDFFEGFSTIVTKEANVDHLHTYAKNPPRGQCKLWLEFLPFKKTFPFFFFAKSHFYLSFLEKTRAVYENWFIV